MFYSQIILAKKGPLAKIWLAAHWDKKLSKPNIFSTDIAKSVDSIVHPSVPLALRVSGYLLLGVVRIYTRKVGYLEHDATEALVKMKLTFQKSSAAGTNHIVEGGGHQDQTTTTKGLNVSHFGEFVDPAEGGGVDGVLDTGYIIPFDVLDSNEQQQEESMEWFTADNTNNNTSTLNNNNNSTTFDTSGSKAVNESSSLLFNEEWGAFNPEEELEGEDRHMFDNTNTNNEHSNDVSDIEMPRQNQARDSTSTMQLNVTDASTIPNRSSMATENNQAFESFDNNFGGDDQQFGEFEVSMEDMNNIGVGNEEVAAVGQKRMSSIGGLESIAEQESVSNNKGRSKGRKRRKVKIDNNATEISSDKMRANIQDWSKLTRVRFADLDKNQGRPSILDDIAAQTSKSSNPKDDFLFNPCFTDNGRTMHPDLVALFTSNRERVFNKNGVADVEAPRLLKEQQQEEEEVNELKDNSNNYNPEEEEVFGGGGGFGGDDQFGLEEEQQQQESLSPPLLDEDEFANTKMNTEGSGFAEELEMNVGRGSLDSAFSLGHVNDIGGNNSNTNNNSGDMSSKWHPHTVTVLQMLRRTMEDQPSKDDTANTKLSYFALSKGCSRRTAAGFFFEILQLKTWDYIDTFQETPDSDIWITRGPNFDKQDESSENLAEES